MSKPSYWDAIRKQVEAEERRKWKARHKSAERDAEMYKHMRKLQDRKRRKRRGRRAS